MTELELLELIGEARDKYVLETAKTRIPRKGHLKLSRTALIAAIIVMALLLAGCVAVFLGLQDMKIGETSYTREYDDYGRRINPTEKTRDILTFAGWSGSPNQLAAREWYEFRESYDPEVAAASGIPDRRGVPNLYWDTYGCEDAKMRDKVDEIAEKYGLKLVEEDVSLGSGQGGLLLNALGLRGVMRQEANIDAEYSGGNVQPPYNFELDVEFTLPGTDWPYRMHGGFSYRHKDYFAPWSTLQLDTSDYRQWAYTTAEGTKALLALGPYGDAYIFAEVEDAYIMVTIGHSNGKFLTDASLIPTKEVVERMADSFDFGIKPREVVGTVLQWEVDKANKRRDEEQAAKNAQYVYSQQQYATFADWMAAEYKTFDGSGYSDFYDYSTYAEGDPAARYYTFHDLDGDGVDELLIGDGTGLFDTMLTVKNGSVVSYPSVIPQGIRLLQTGGMAYCEEPTVTDSECLRWYCKPFAEGQVLEFQEDQMNVRTGGVAERVEYRQQQWYRITSFLPKEMTSITGEEAQAIMDKYPELELTWYPCIGYPVDETGKTIGDMIREQDVPSTAEERLALYRTEGVERARKIYSGNTLCALLDIDGDGMEELLISYNGSQIHCAFTVRYGELNNIFVRNAYLCENGVLEDVREHFAQDVGQQLHHTYYRMNGTRREQLDFVLENVTDGTFASNLDGTPMTAEEAAAIMGKYPRVNIDWQLISQFAGE